MPIFICVYASFYLVQRGFICHTEANLQDMGAKCVSTSTVELRPEDVSEKKLDFNSNL